MIQPEIAVLSGKDLMMITRALESIEDKLTKVLTKFETELPQRWIKAPQLCKYLGFSRTVLDKLIAEGKIKAYHVNGKPGGDRYFKIEDIYSVEESIFS
jgi:excisionase family DNA binding protein